MFLIYRINHKRYFFFLKNKFHCTRKHIYNVSPRSVGQKLFNEDSMIESNIMIKIFKKEERSNTAKPSL